MPRIQLQVFAFNSFIFPFNYSMKMKTFCFNFTSEKRRERAREKKCAFCGWPARPTQTLRLAGKAYTGTALLLHIVQTRNCTILYANCKISIIQRTQHAVLARARVRCACVLVFMPILVKPLTAAQSALPTTNTQFVPQIVFIT